MRKIKDILECASAIFVAALILWFLFGGVL